VKGSLMGGGRKSTSRSLEVIPIAGPRAGGTPTHRPLTNSIIKGFTRRGGLLGQSADTDFAARGRPARMRKCLRRKESYYLKNKTKPLAKADQKSPTGSGDHKKWPRR